MRLNMTTQGGLADEFMSGGGSVINPLILAGNPIQPQEAATKQYVDNSLLTLNASNLISGTVPGSRFPAMNGDFTSSPGSVALTLTNTGVVAGSYAKVSVDNKGRVTNGLPLIESDIPNFSWNKVNADRPTTLSGYGITDALGVSGGTLTGSISVNGTVNGSTQLVNKSYLDSVLGASTGIAVGDIIAKIDNTTPDGFLKCNGAELDKTTYASLYAAIGDTYTLNGKAGNGQPWRNQYEINKENYSSLVSWKSGPSLPGLLSGGASFVTKNRVYIFGGYNGSSQVGTGYTAAVNTDGTLGPWTTTTSLPGVYSYAQAVVSKNKVYIISGYVNNTTPTNVTYTADINSDGTIGTWTNGPTLPASIAGSSVFINKNIIYVLGGYNGSIAVNTIYSSIIKEDGSLSPWITEAPLPFTLYASVVVSIKNRIYILAGQQNGSFVSTIYSTNLNSDGSIGTWTMTGSLPIVNNWFQAFVTGNMLYMIAGNTGATSSISSVYRAIINADGSIGTWSLENTTYPNVLQYSSCVILKNKVYLIGGHNGSTPLSNVYFSDIGGGLNDYSAFYSMAEEQNFMVAGSGRPWQQQYQLNITQTDDITGWVTDTSILPLSAGVLQAVVTKNRVYIFGGFTGSNSPTSNVYTAPINTDGTLGTWVIDTALPIAIGQASLAITANRVYLLGGYNGSSYLSSVYTAPINSDGTLGAWTTGPSLPAARCAGDCFVTRNRLYLIGGSNGSFSSSVYSSTIYPDGTISSWRTETSLPISLGYTSVVVTKNYVYLLGGYNGAWLSTVYSATVNSDGTLGFWKQNGSLPISIAVCQTLVTKNKVYLIGGQVAGGSVSSVYMATINADGVLGSWTSGTNLPNTLSQSMLITTNNRIYLLGGYRSGSYINTIFSAPILEGSNDYSSYYAEDTVNYCYPGSGKPWSQQYQINATQSADITGWTTDTSLPGVFGWSSAIVTKNRVYLCGGSTGATTVTTVYTAPINSDGTLGTWVTGTSLPGALSTSQAVVTKNRVYLLGGYNNSVYTSTVYTAPINTDGTLGAWTTGTSLPVGMGYSQAIVTNKRVYLLGGYNGSYLTTVYTAVINADGTLGGWIAGTSLPVGMSYLSAIVTKNRIYLLGGYNASGYTSIYTTSISADGQLGTWSVSGNLPAGVMSSQAVVVKNKVYVFGGWSAAPNSNIVYTATINSDGTLGNWTTGTSLPAGLHNSQVIVTKNRVYLLGGARGLWTDAVSNVYSAAISEGSNDYSTYYNGDISPIEQFTTVPKFKIPDSTYVNDGLNYFIKI